MDPADDILAILQVCVCFFLGWFYIKTFCPFCQKVGCWWSPGMDKKVTSPASLGLPRLARLLEGRNGHVLALEHIEERMPISSPETQMYKCRRTWGKEPQGCFYLQPYLACFRNICCFCPGWLLFFRLTLLEEHIVAWQWWKMSLLLDGVPVSMFHGVYQPYHVLLESYYHLFGRMVWCHKELAFEAQKNVSKQHQDLVTTSKTARLSVSVKGHRMVCPT